ncbi:MAG: hypothetical protein EBU62_12890 [Proteobacteria bacterium]|nr:hypothetical protein [Pseudomonadota bacterium]
MLMPKRVKYRRMHRGNMRGAASRGNFIAFGQFGLQALEPCWCRVRFPSTCPRCGSTNRRCGAQRQKLQPSFTAILRVRFR